MPASPPTSPTSDPLPSRRAFWFAASAGILLLILLGAHRLRRDGADDPRAENAVAVSESSPPAAAASASSAVAETGEIWLEPEPRPGVDGSHIYKAAFQLYDRLSEEEKKMITHPTDEVDADQAAALFEKLKPLMELLHQGADADYCDWALGPLSFEMPMTHLSKAMDLGKAARWFAAYRFPTEPDAAISDLTARAQLGRDVSDAMIGLLVNISFESSAAELLRQNVEHFTPAAFANARALMDGTLTSEEIAHSLAAEVAGAEAFFKRLVASSNEERTKLLGTAESDFSPEQRAALKSLNDPAQLKAELDYVLQLQRRSIAAFQMPEAQYQAGKQEVQASLAGHPLTAALVPAYESVREKMQQANVQREMLKAGLDLLQSGPALAGQTRDPNSGQPFIYQPSEAGFTLTSTFKVKGKPVTMSFPKRP